MFVQPWKYMDPVRELGPDATVAPMYWEKIAESAWTCANDARKTRQRRAVEKPDIMARKLGDVCEDRTTLVATT